jgi:hypothetical protein
MMDVVLVIDVPDVCGLPSRLNVVCITMDGDTLEVYARAEWPCYKGCDVTFIVVRTREPVEPLPWEQHRMHFPEIDMGTGTGLKFESLFDHRAGADGHEIYYATGRLASAVRNAVEFARVEIDANRHSIARELAERSARQSIEDH